MNDAAPPVSIVGLIVLSALAKMIGHGFYAPVRSVRDIVP